MVKKKLVRLAVSYVNETLKNIIRNIFLKHIFVLPKAVGGALNLWCLPYCITKKIVFNPLQVMSEPNMVSLGGCILLLIICTWRYLLHLKIICTAIENRKKHISIMFNFIKFYTLSSYKSISG